MNDRYEILTLVDDQDLDRGVVIFNTTIGRVLDLKLFPEVEDAEAFIKWLKIVHKINDHLSARIWHLAHLQKKWIKTKQESALAAERDVTRMSTKDLHRQLGDCLKKHKEFTNDG